MSRIARAPPIVMGRIAQSNPVPPVRDGYARKRFGQHFLRDRTVIRRIVDAIAPQPGELVVEIGPGRGALTFPLLASGCELHAVEIDRNLAARLRAQAAHHSNLIVHETDALEIDLTRIAPPPSADSRRRQSSLQHLDTSVVPASPRSCRESRTCT